MKQTNAIDESSNTELGGQTCTTAQRAAQALKRHGVEVIFGQSLPSALILACEDIGIRQYVYRTENAAGTMADGYARISNKVGVVTAQNGPAATLLVPPLAEAYKASIPILACVQEVNRPQAGRNAFQELDHIGLFQSSVKSIRVVDDPARVEDHIDNAMITATSGRPGPVVLLFPADVLIESCPSIPFPRTQSYGAWPTDRVMPAAELLDDITRMIVEAESPLIVAGGGIHGSGATTALAELQEKAHIPVAYTMMGKGTVSDCHPLTVGLIGNVMGEMSLGRHVRALIDTADMIVFVGTRTNQNGTDSWTLFPNSARFIHIDIASEEIGRTYESVRVKGDAKLTLNGMLNVINDLDLRKRLAKRPIIEGQIKSAILAREQATQSLRTSSAQPIRPERIMQELQGVLDDSSTVVADASYSSVWVTSYLQASQPGVRFLTPRGLAGLGWGYPMALGAKVAAPDSNVFCVVGDGGFAHCWAELETAARTDTPVILLVLNNAVLGYQKDAESVKFGRYTSACHFKEVDHMAIAQACGVNAIRIEDPDELAGHFNEAVQQNQCTLFDIITDPEAYPPLTMYDGRFK